MDDSVEIKNEEQDPCPRIVDSRRVDNEVDGAPNADKDGSSTEDIQDDVDDLPMLVDFFLWDQEIEDVGYQHEDWEGESCGINARECAEEDTHQQDANEQQSRHEDVEV